MNRTPDVRTLYDETVNTAGVFLNVYVVVGLTAVLTNTLILAVLQSDKRYMHASAFIAGYAGGNLINGLAHLLGGVYRTVLRSRGEHMQLITVWQCMLTVVPSLFLLGTQIPSVLLVAIGVERFYAVAAPTHYYHGWTYSRSWSIVGFVYIYALTVVLSAWIVVGVAYADVYTTSSCLIPAVIGEEFTELHYGVSVVGGTVAGALTLAALCIGQRRLNRAKLSAANIGHRIRKQNMLTRAMLSIVVCDQALVVVPNLLLFIRSGYGQTAPVSGYLASSAYCCNSALVVFAYLAFNKDFRRKTFRFVGFIRWCQCCYSCRWTVDETTADGRPRPSVNRPTAEIATISKHPTMEPSSCITEQRRL